MTVIIKTLDCETGEFLDLEIDEEALAEMEQAEREAQERYMAAAERDLIAEWLAASYERHGS